MKEGNCFGLYIDGKWVESVSGETFPTDNPAKPKQVLGTFQKGNKEDAARAIEAAEARFENWSETPAPKRGLILLRAAHFAARAQGETGEGDDHGNGKGHQ